MIHDPNQVEAEVFAMYGLIHSSRLRSCAPAVCEEVCPEGLAAFAARLILWEPPEESRERLRPDYAEPPSAVLRIR